MCDGGDGCAVKVAVRIRPLLEKEVAEQARVCSRVINDHQVVLGKDRAFTFDNLFDENAAQKEIYDACISSLMTQFFKGYNCTILAYGQTGSGKTHTMGTGDLSRVSPEEQGIVPRVARDIFATIKEKKRRAARSGVDLSITCRLSYIEIYNEALKDLLRPSTPSRHLQIREDSSGEIVVTGVYEQEVSSCEDMIQQLQIGTFARTTGSTLMNESSSRSHSILTVILVQHQMSAADVAVMGGSSRGRVKGATVSKLHLVDLAGSERNKKTQAVGQRFRESVSINSGLLALGNVISVLGEQNAPPSAAPTSTRPANSPSEPAHTGGDLAENNTTTTTTTQHQQQQQQQREEVPGGGVAAEEAEQGVGHLSDSFARRSLAPEGSEGLKAAAAIDGGAVSAGGALPAAARRTHVPYRDSKLTRLLQDSLGGNASTLMIACVSPADSNFEETLNTLKYANRAKNIRNKPVINADPRQLVADRLRNELAACKKALAAHGIQDPTAAAAEGGGDAAAEGLQSAASALSGGVCSRKACAAARGQLAACRLALAANGVPEPGGGGGGDAPAERCRELQQEYGTMEADLTASLHDEP
ncbi:Kinesin-like protein KIN-4A, partial [Diplonema papillatum]